MATALTPSPGPSQEVFKVQWSKELEQNVNPDGQLRNGPRYVPFGDTIEELITNVATHRGISVDDLFGSDPGKDEDGKKYCKCRLCLSSMLDNDRARKRHHTSDLHINYVSLYCHADYNTLMSLALICERCDTYRSYRTDAMKTHTERCRRDPQSKNKGKQKAFRTPTDKLACQTSTATMPLPLPSALASSSSAPSTPDGDPSNSAGPSRHERRTRDARERFPHPYAKSTRKASNRDQAIIASVNEMIRNLPHDRKLTTDELPPALRPFHEREERRLAGLPYGVDEGNVEEAPSPIGDEVFVVQRAGDQEISEASFDSEQDFFDQFIVDEPDLFEPPPIRSPSAPYVSELQHALDPPARLRLHEQEQRHIVPESNILQDFQQPTLEPNMPAANTQPDIDLSAFLQPRFVPPPPVQYPQYNPMPQKYNYGAQLPLADPFTLPSFPAFPAMPQCYGPMAHNMNLPPMYHSVPTGAPQQIPAPAPNLPLADLWTYGDVSYQNLPNYQGFFPSYPQLPF